MAERYPSDALGFLKEIDQINMRRRVRMVDLAREVCGGSPRWAPTWCVAVHRVVRILPSRPGEFGLLVNHRRMLDGPNALDPDAWRAAGWTDRALGRP
jgi:hypothetical protein